MRYRRCAVFRECDSTTFIHGFVDDFGRNVMIGDKLVDPYMYPGMCVDYCNKKGGSARQKFPI